VPVILRARQITVEATVAERGGWNVRYGDEGSTEWLSDLELHRRFEPINDFSNWR
jgi:hypothetical protein